MQFSTSFTASSGFKAPTSSKFSSGKWGWSLGLLMMMVVMGSGTAWGQANITAVSPTITEAFTGYAGTSTLPTNWTTSGTGSFNGTNQTTGMTGGWYGNNNMSYLGSGTASNGNATWTLRNTTGATITAITVSFDARMWRSNTASPSVTVSYSTSSSATVPAAGVLTNSLSSLTFNDATTNISTGTTLTQTVTGLSIANNNYIFLRFVHPGGSSSDNLGWDNVTVTASAASNYFRSKATGNWNAASTWESSFDGTNWVNASLPPDNNANTITILNGHTVTVTAAVSADQVIVNTGGTLAVSATLTNTAGNLNVNGTFQINTGGFASGGTWVYGAGATLVYNHTASTYGPIDAGHSYWPASNGPTNVTIQGATGNIDLGVSRTVSGIFQTAAGITLSSGAVLTLNGTCRINAGGFFNNAPTHGSSSTLEYNTGTTFGRGNEWSATSGAGYPNNVTINAGSALDLGNGGTGTARQCAGNLLLNGALYMDFGANDMTQALTVLGNLTIGTAGALSLSDAVGGDLKLQGNWVRTGAGVFTPKGRAVFFQGGNAQTLTGITTFNFLNMGKSANNLTLIDDITITNTLTLSDGTNGGNANGGIIDGVSNTKSVTIGSSGLNTGGSATSHVSGKLIQSYTGTGSKTFMIGKGGNYRPLILNYTALTGTSVVSAEQFESTIPGSIPAGVTLQTGRYWTVTQTGGSGFTYNITLDGSTFTPVGNPVILKGDGVTNTVFGATFNIPDYNFTTNGLTSLSNFAVGAAASNCPASTAVTSAVDQAVCTTNTANQLTANITTSGGLGSPTFLYQWYYNTTNSNTVAGATLIPGATNQTYTPLATGAELGTRYYFSVGYAADNGCNQTNVTQALASNTVKVTVTLQPSAGISYPGDPFCSNAGTAMVTLTGTSGGTYSSTAGLSLNASTGAVDLGASTAGTYTVTYALAASGGCPAVTANTSITINASTTNTTTIVACDSYTWSVTGVTYTTSGTYTATSTNPAGCPHTETLVLTINASTSNSTSITACDSYTWSVNGTTYTASGTYSATSTNPAGCPHTETLVLTINASTSNSTSITACDSYTWSVNGVTYTTSGTYTATSTNPAGCPHTETLVLTINLSTSNTTTITACDTYVWSVNNTTYTTSGTYTATSTNPAGCPHTETLVLTINASTSNSTSITACDSYTWSVNGTTYTTSGTYTATSTNPAGCPHTETLVLTINASTSNTTTITACDTYVWSVNNTIYTTSGTYSATSTNPAGCPHTETLELTINLSTSNTTTITACDTYVWSVNNTTYTASGTYTATSTNPAGCPHTETLELTINLSTSNTTTITACDTYVWSVNNTTYTASGTYTATSTNPAGCPHTETLVLTINASTSNTTTIVACDSYTWSVTGITYTTSGTYTGTTTNASGCPQAETLVLTINASTSNTTTIVACDSYTWSVNGITYTTSGTYTGTTTNASGCPQAETLVLTINASTTNTTTIVACDSYTWSVTSITYTTSGTYTGTTTNAAGCPQAETLVLTINASTSNTTTIVACDSYTWSVTGITYTTSGTYTGTTTNASGCPQAETLVLTINASTTNTTTIVACDSYTWSVTGITYTTSGTYTGTTTNAAGCPQAETLVLTINASTTNTTTIVACDSYTWSVTGVTYTTSGTYTATSTNPAGCLHTETLVLTINASTSNSTSITACDSYTWSVNGTTYTTSGTYTATSTNPAGCPHTETLVLTINASTSNSTSITACDSYTWSVNGTTYTTSGTYTVTSTNPAGCPHTETLVLTINASTSNSTSITACDSYTWSVNGTTYTTSGTYTATSTNPAGCPHTETLVLTINASTSNSTSITACDSYTWSVNGTTYTTSGTYTATSTNPAGCLNTETLVLTINASTSNSTSITACDSYTWSVTGVTYTASGTYTGTTTNASGCPQAETLVLTINASTANTTTIVACDSYTWSVTGITYTASGTYTGTTTNASGCPQAETLVLTINASTANTTTIVACDSYTWSVTGVTYTTSGTYTGTTTNASGCPQAETLVLTINASTTNTTTIVACDSYTWSVTGVTYTTSGTYTGTTTNASGCPQAETLVLTINLSTSNTMTIVACDSYTWSVTGVTYTTSGTYTGTTTNASGCPQAETLLLTINLSTSNTTTIVACDSYTWSVTGVTYTMSGTYTGTTTNASGCPQAETLVLTINLSTSNTMTIVACDSYTWSVTGVTYTTSGTYTGTTTNASGCPQAETLLLTINLSTSNTTTIVACDSYTWSVTGVTYTMSGTYTGTTTNALGCPQAETLVLTINASTSNTTTIVACDSYTWSVNGITYTTSGTYTGTTTNASGCPQAETLVLTINASTTNTTTIVACDSYTWSVTGVTYTTSGTYTGTTTNVSGCPQAETLVLTINASTTNTTTIVACDSYTWSVTGVTYTASGTYTGTTTNASGCPQAETLVLTINASTANTTTIVACDSYTWSVTGVTYTISGTYTGTTTNAAGCPQAETLVLTINASTANTTTIVACDSYTWSVTGITYTTSGTYTGTTTNASGCPQAETLVLTINASTANTTTIVACDSYTWSVTGVTYTMSGTYTGTTTNASGCPQAETLVLTINASTTNTTTIVACDSYTWSVTGVTYTASGTYTGTTTNASGCPQAETLVLTINASTTNTTTIVACDSYTWSVTGVTYTTSGTYTGTTTNASGCPQAETLVLTINLSTSNTTTIVACDSYTWSVTGVTYTTSGTYTGTTTNASGCPQAETLLLTINLSTSNTTTIVACDSYTWSVTGVTYTMSGTYTGTTTNALGCPQAETLVLTINASTTNTTTIVACDSYTWSVTGITYTTSGTYTGTTTNAAGCPQAETLVLTINASTSNTTTIVACDSYTWSVNGITYTTSGTYTGTTTNASGCPQAETLVLTINASTTNTTTIVACDSYTWSVTGITYTTSGTYTGTTTNASGCPQAETLVLTINASTANTTTIVACDSYTWSVTGVTYTMSGTYTGTTTNASGCPQAETLVLTINASTTNTTTIVACDSYTWSVTGVTYTASGTYTGTTTNASGCPQAETLVLTINASTANTTTIVACDSYTWSVTGVTYTMSGTYTGTTTNASGCPQAETLVLTINASTANTTTIVACDSYTWSVTGVTYTMSGTYTGTTTNASGCPQAETLVLTINASTTNTTTIMACDSYTWSVTGVTYTTSGTYTGITTNASGCPQAETLVLTINASTANTTTIVACDSYTWSVTGITYTASGTYTGTTTNASGCPQAETLVLTINASTANTTTIVACDSYTWSVTGVTYTTSGTYTGTTTNASGCPQAETLVLTINASTTNTTTIVACDSYTWSVTGVTYTTSGTYTGTTTNASGCPQAETLVLTINASTSNTTTITACDFYKWSVDGMTYTTSGTYTLVSGCHTETLILTINPLPTVAPITGNVNVPANETSQLSDATAGGVWDSSDDNIATVSSTGLVTGVTAGGTAIISYTVTDGNGCSNSATVTIIVGLPLPVELSEFTATATPNRTVNLDWISNIEVNLAYYGVEYSTNGRDFSQLGQVEAKGTTSLPTAYSYLHLKPQSGMIYYRLRLVNRDGTFDYSPIQSATLENRNDFSLMPTPTSGPLTLISENLDQYTAGLKYRLTDNLGKVLMTDNIVNERTNLNLSAYAPGIYHLTVFSDREQWKQFKVIVSKN